MPLIDTMAESRFLKQADVGAGSLVTIESVTQINVAKKEDPEELKWCASFAECEKPLPLNLENREMIATINGSRNSDDWPGTKLVLYANPNIMFGGKKVGGIRIRAPKNQGTTPARPPAGLLPADQDGHDGADRIPF